MKFYLNLLERENIMENYRDCKKKVMEDVKNFGGVLWETAYEIKQLYIMGVLSDEQYNKLCELSKSE